MDRAVPNSPSPPLGSGYRRFAVAEIQQRRRTSPIPLPPPPSDATEQPDVIDMMMGIESPRGST